MARVLERRPALCFDAGERSAVDHWTEDATARVEAIAEAWIATLRDAVTRAFSDGAARTG
jgi:hypothetical protein